MLENLIQSVIQIQNRLSDDNISSAVIGGLAVAVWGEPRLTRDVDIKVSLQRDQAADLLSLLKADYSFLSDNPEQTLRQMGMLFVQDVAGLRLDLLLADTSFDIEVIQRASPKEIEPGQIITVCTPEDLILYKMISTRPRDHEDVQGVMRRQQHNLDDDYILDWLQQFEVALDDATLVAEYRRLRGL